MHRRRFPILRPPLFYAAMGAVLTFRFAGDAKANYRSRRGMLKARRNEISEWNIDYLEKRPS